MEEAVLLRTRTGDQGTFGVFLSGEFTCYTVELPWRENARNFSCIEKGRYRVEPHRSPRFGKCYWVKNVSGRSEILIHTGNVAGDRRRGHLTHSNGCILPGKRLGSIKGQRAVLNSRSAVSRMARHLGNKPFMLTIREVYDV